MKKGNVKKFHQDNRGGAMAMVLVIIAFISILAAVLMFVAYGGYQMRLMDEQGKDNFYTAETVLDEINAGLQIEISQALSKSYEKVMTNYALYETAEKRSAEFYNVYYAELQDALQLDASHPNQYNIATLRGYLSPDVLGNGRPGEGVSPDGSRTNFGSYGAIVESAVVPEAYTLVLKNDGIVLKDLKVSYVNERGYVSIITTDIRIALPQANFAQSSAFPDINDYCLIADETLQMGNTHAGGKVVVKGNAYAGRMQLGKVAGTPMLSCSVQFEKWTEPGETPDDTLGVVVSREDIEVTDSALKTTDMELWGENLFLESSKAELNGSTNLKDDLVLNGTGSQAVIAGEYAGFGNADDAELSSAIIVNGKDSVLDLRGLTSMNINGRAYVATAYKEGDTVADEREKNNAANVVMGESVAVKSNQLIYLVPPEALGCKKGEDGSVGESAFGSNPLKLEQYEEIVNNPDKYVLLDGTKQIAALGFNSLNSYIKQEDVAGGEKAYVPEVIFKQTNAGPLVYCYLRFKDEEAANRYFADYYHVNASRVDSYTKLYAREIRMGDINSLLYLNLSGNMLSYAAGGSSSLIEATDSYGQQKAADVISITKGDIFKALSAKMVTNIAQLSSAEQGQTAFPNVIYEAKVKEIINKFDLYGTGTVQFETNGADVKSTILSKYDYVVDNSTPSNVHMIICLGNVTVKKDFQGLIISAKNIIVEDSLDDNHEVIIQPLSLEDFGELLNAKKEIGGEQYYILDVFQDGQNYASLGSTTQDLGTQQVSMAGLIIYERWSKR